MKKLFAILLAASMLFTVIPQGNASADTSQVAVKLVNYIGKNSSIDVKVTGNYRISETGSALNSGQTYTVKASSGVLSLYSGNQKLREFGAQFSMVPVTYGTSSTLTIQNGNSYTGTITFQAEGSIVTPVNKLPMEDYLKGVLPKEVSSAYPLASLKAQAVSARTHASRFTSAGKTMDDTTSYQVYGGYSS
ncbi:SpoIID/LytB domain-containing protein [Paenibacillus larvae]